MQFLSVWDIAQIFKFFLFYCWRKAFKQTVISCLTEGTDQSTSSHLQRSALHLGWFLPSLGTFGNLGTCLVITAGGCYWHLVGTSQGCCLISFMCGTALTTNNYAAPNISNAKVKKLCSRARSLPEHGVKEMVYIINNPYAGSECVVVKLTGRKE